MTEINNTGLTELSGKGMPLFSRPFLFASNQRAKILKAFNDEDEVIRERDGIPFINKDILKPGKDTEKNLDRKFKDLVDSVLDFTSSNSGGSR